jgi:bisphosphoglycerate-independent phosphoglycerate mutase (AlkP superfamily)
MTAFLSKHREAFEPDTHSKKKWRERRVENDAFEIKRQEEKIVKQEINRQKADKMLGADVTTKVMDSGDRLKIAAFNQDRAGQLMAILLESKYVRSRTKIGKE